MNNIWRAITEQFEIAEKMLESSGKHIIKTETIKDGFRNKVSVEGINSDSDYLIDIGIGQVIQSVLYSHGYRSIQRGYFVNLDRCNNPVYLKRLAENAETSLESKRLIYARINEIKKIWCDPQLRFYNVNCDIIEPTTAEEFDRMLEEDAI